MTLKFEANRMDPNYTMAENLWAMSAMIHDMKGAISFLVMTKRFLLSSGHNMIVGKP